MTVFSTSSTARLTDRDLNRFPGGTLFDRMARAVCHAGCLPRKELYEAWEMAKRVRRLFRGGRVVDLGAGHGLLAQVMLLLDDSSPSAVVVDTALPASAPRVHASLVAVWPRLDGRVTFAVGDLETVAVSSDDLIVSCHACGRLTDRVLERAVGARARVAVLPCCHGRDPQGTQVAPMLDGWMDPALALDVDRAQRLAHAGYHVWTQRIPPDITPKNRLLIGAPRPQPA
jgi:hypothetical protein